MTISRLQVNRSREEPRNFPWKRGSQSGDLACFCRLTLPNGIIARCQSEYAAALWQGNVSSTLKMWSEQGAGIEIAVNSPITSSHLQETNACMLSS